LIHEALREQLARYNGVDTEAVRRALAGVYDKDAITDYNGRQVLSAYGPVDVYGVTWAVLKEGFRNWN